jgi:hypothetical protein
MLEEHTDRNKQGQGEREEARGSGKCRDGGWNKKKTWRKFNEIRDHDVISVH